jgi:hypothetical protein
LRLRKRTHAPLTASFRNRIGALPLLTLALLSACAPERTIPKWDGKIWVGDSAARALVFTPSDEKGNRLPNIKIPSDSPEFDQYLAMSAKDFKRFYATYVLECKEWRKEAH